MSEIALPITARGWPLPSERLLSDERLAHLVARGAGRHAFATLYERHHQAIYRYCRSLLGEEHDAQDALQNTMLHAYAALRTRERDVAVRPWLFRIAHNESISILRRRDTRSHPSSEDDLAESALTQGVEQTLHARERLDLLVADLRTLPERQRAALLMRELSGLSIAEIAAALMITPGAAKQAVFEARSALHELAEGRTMECESVRQAISRRDGRVLRARRIAAHLRACEECRAFRAAIFARRADLLALAPPLPAASATAMLGRLLLGGGAGGGAHAGGAAIGGQAIGGQAAGQAAAATGQSAVLAGSHLAGATVLAKGLAGVAMLAATTAGAVRVVDRVAGQSHRHSSGGVVAATALAPAMRPLSAPNAVTGVAIPFGAGAAPAFTSHAELPLNVLAPSGAFLANGVSLRGAHGSAPATARANGVQAHGAQANGRTAHAHGNGEGRGATGAVRAHGAMGEHGHGAGAPAGEGASNGHGKGQDGSRGAQQVRHRAEAGHTPSAYPPSRNGSSLEHSNGSAHGLDGSPQDSARSSSRTHDASIPASTPAGEQATHGAKGAHASSESAPDPGALEETHGSSAEHAAGQNRPD